MQTYNLQPPVQDDLSDEVLTEIIIGYGPNLKELSAMFSGRELIEEVIKNSQNYAARALGHSFDFNMSEANSHTIETIRRITSGILQRLLPSFISDHNREFIVRCHAHGLSTSMAVSELINEDDTMAQLAEPDAVGFKELKSELVSRLAYLKPGAVRWPEKKYGTIWREEREHHKATARDIPFTSPTEQALLLSKHVTRVDDMLDQNEHSATDWQLLTNSLIKTLDSLQKISTPEQQMPTNLSGAQLIGVLERLTLTSNAPGQLASSADTDALIAVLERLTLALKSPEHKAIASKVKAIPAAITTDDDTSA